MPNLRYLLLALVMGTPLAQSGEATAVFAGGCFWCMESDFQDRAGVVDVISGFTGGKLKNPTYEGDHSGHWEAVQITYDPDTVSYQQLLDVYWHNIDPLDGGGQFCDRGHSYLSAVFVADEEQAKLAQASRAQVVEKFKGKAVATEILPAGTFWPVEEYHQDYYLKNPLRYKYYRWNCGRDQRLEELWGQSSSH